MAWTPRYVGGKLSIVPDNDEDFANQAIFDRIREIESDIRSLVLSAKDGKFEAIAMIRLFGQITGLFGMRDFIVYHGPQDEEAAARFDESIELDKRLNAELDARL